MRRSNETKQCINVNERLAKALGSKTTSQKVEMVRGPPLEDTQQLEAT